MKACLCSTKVLFRELFYCIMPYQQYEKSRQIGWHVSIVQFDVDFFNQCSVPENKNQLQDSIVYMTLNTQSPN